MKFTFGRQQSDSSLISAVKKGDKGAYEQLFVRYYPTLLRFIHGMLKDNHMAEDIAQNIFMKLWIHREKLDSTQSLKTTYSYWPNMKYSTFSRPSVRPCSPCCPSSTTAISKIEAIRSKSNTTMPN